MNTSENKSNEKFVGEQATQTELEKIINTLQAQRALFERDSRSIKELTIRLGGDAPSNRPTPEDKNREAASTLGQLNIIIEDLMTIHNDMEMDIASLQTII